MAMNAAQTLSFRERKKIAEFYHEKQCTHKTALATLVASSGSSLRKVGSRLIMTESGQFAGSLSGGCIEAHIFGEAKTQFNGGMPQLLNIHTGSLEDDLFGSGVGCEGSLEILVQSLPSGMAYDEAAKFFGTPRDQSDKYINHYLDGNKEYSTNPDRTALFCEKICPVPTLVAFGASEVCNIIIELSNVVGWDALHINHLGASGPNIINRRATDICFETELPEQPYIIIATHNLQHDLDILEQLSAIKARYIGIVGSALRTQKLFKLAEQQGVPHSLLNTINAPAGIGGIRQYTPEAIALSIITQITQLDENSPQQLRGQTEHSIAIGSQL